MHLQNITLQCIQRVTVLTEVQQTRDSRDSDRPVPMTLTLSNLQPVILRALRYGVVLGYLLLAGCAWHGGGDKQRLRSAQVQTWHGEVSCPGCSERWLTLTLFPDGLFRLRETYVAGKGGSNERFHDVGRWSAPFGDPTRLILQGASPRQFRLTVAGDLSLLDANGQDIVSIRDYVLKRQFKPDHINEPMRLLALYAGASSAGQPAAVTECLTAQVVEIMETPAAALMQQAVQSIAPERRARGPVLASMTASWQDVAVGKSASSKPMLKITAFERFWPNETCAQGPMAPAHPMQETIWRLTSLKGVAVQEAVLGQAAHIRLRAGGRLTGTTGCNRLQGNWQLAEDGIALSRLSSTRAMCRDAMAQQERALMEVLKNAKHYRQVGHQLELLQGEQVLARFVATEMM